MQRTKKIFMALLMGLMTLVCVIGLGACSDNGCGGNENPDNNEVNGEQEVVYESTEGLEYTLSQDGTYYICSGVGTAKGKEIVIGSKYNNLPVTEIAENAFTYNNTLTKVTIPESIKIIGKNAFNGCNLLNYNYANGGLYLGNNENAHYAFIGLSDSTIKNFTMEEASEILAEGSLQNKTDLLVVVLSKNVYNVQEGFLTGSISVKELTMPCLTGEVANKEAFNYRKYFGDTSTESFEKFTLYGKTQNSFITTGSNSTLVVGDNFTEIQEGDYSSSASMPSAQTVIIGDSIKRIGDYTFEGTGVKNLTIGNGVTEIGFSAFDECSNLSNITFGENIETIENYAFSNCNLTSITLPKNVISISGAFHSNSNLTQVTLNDKLENIGYYTFQDCNLSYISIPDSVKEIGYNAFDGNDNLHFNTYKNAKYLGNDENDYLWLVNVIDATQSDMYIHKDVNGIMVSNAYYNNSKLKNVYYEGESVNDWVGIHFQSASYSSGSSSNNRVLPLWSGAKLYINGQFVINANITSATEINGYAFYYYDYITELTIGRQVKSVGTYALYACDSLTKINYTGDINQWVEIDFTVTPLYDRYYHSSSDKYITTRRDLYINNQLVTEANITSATKIDGSALYNYDKLTKVFIGKQVGSIDSGAFGNCANLNAIYYGGNVDEWVQIEFGSGILSNRDLYINDQIVTEVNLTKATEIKDYSFDNYAKIEKVVIGNQVTSIGSSAFNNCDLLKEVSIGNGVTSIGEDAFNNSAINTLILPNSLVDIGEDAFGDCYYLKNVVVGNGVTTIDDYAFSGCKTLTDITLSDEITSIGESAFSDCYFIESITIPSSVTSIGSSAFSNCKLLEKVYYKGTIDQWAEIDFGSSSANPLTYAKEFYINNQLVTEVDLTNATKIDENAFVGENLFTTINIGEKVKEISSSTFSACGSLESITVDSKNPNYSSFDGILYSKDLTEIISIPKAIKGDVVLAEGLLSIGDSMFSGFSELTSLTISNSVTSVGQYAFSGLTAEIKWGDDPKVESIGINFFSGYQGSIINIPKSIKTVNELALYNYKGTIEKVYYSGTIDEWATITWGYWTSSYNGSYYSDILRLTDEFYVDNKLVTEITLTKTESVSQFAFRGYDKLTKVTIGGNVKSLGYNSFASCENLKTIVFDTSCKLETIGSRAFAWCTVLSCLELPASLTTVGEGAFYACDSLSKVVLNSKVDIYTYSGYNEYLNSFEQCNNLKEVINKGGLSVSVGSKSNGYVAYYANQVITDERDTDFIISGDYTFYNADDGYSLISYNGSNDELTLPENINGNSYKIFNYAFYNNKHITSVIIPDGVTSIGSYAFSGCSSLKNVTLGKDIITINGYAFSECEALEKVYYLGDVNKWVQIDFTYSDSNPLSYAQELYINNQLVTEANINNSTKIEDYAFYKYDKLTKVSMTNTVESVGSLAFSDCSSLKEITIPSTLTSIGSLFSNCEALEKVYYLGTIDQWVTIDFSYSYNSWTGVTSVSNPLLYASELYINDTLVTEANILSATTIDDASFYNYDKLTKVIIGNQVTSIGSRAFYGCDMLYDVINNSELSITAGSSSNGYVAYYAKIIMTEEDTTNNYLRDGDYLFYNSNEEYYLYGYEGTATELTLPNKINNCDYSINKEAFYNNDTIKSVVIPSGVISIGDNAFNSLEKIYYLGTVEQWSQINFASYYNPLESGAKLYINNNLVTDIVLNNITHINADAFSGYKYLTSVVLGDSIESIGYRAFLYCTNLVSVTVGSGLKSVADDPNGVFNGCYKLIEVINKSNLDIVAGSYNYESLAYYAKQVITDEADSKIIRDGDYIFYNDNGKYYLLSYKGLSKEITLPQNINGNNYEIYKYAFSNNNDLIKVIIPKGVTNVGQYAFQYCDSLTSVTLEKGVKQIESYAFSNCTALNELIFSDATYWIQGGSNPISSDVLQNSNTAAEHIKNNYSALIQYVN